MLTTLPTVNPPDARPSLEERARAALVRAIGEDAHAGTIAARLAQDAVQAAHGGDSDLAFCLHDAVRDILRRANTRERMERESNRERDGVLFTVAALPAGSR